MKKLAQTLFLMCVLVMTLCVTALAVDATTDGIYNLTVSNGATIEPNGTATPDVTVNGAAVSNFYAKADQMTVTVPTNGSNAQYLVLALEGSGKTPDVDNIVYINQNGSGVFTVYPSQLKSGQEYHIYITSDTDSRYNGASGLTEVGSFRYYAAYKLGDVDGNGNINVADALDIIAHFVGKTTLSGNKFLAADINGDGNVNPSDAMDVIAHFVGRNLIG